MKKFFFRLLTIILACTVVGLLIEFFCNFKLLTLDDKNKSDTNISFTTSIEDEKTIIRYTPSENRFINKLVIDYDNSEDINFTLSYTYPGEYGINTTNEISGNFNSFLKQSTNNINNSTSEIVIKYEQINDFTIKSISVDNNPHFNFTRFMCVFLASLLVILFIYYYQQGFCNEKIHIYFATICSIIGMIFIIAQPATTLYSFDDQIHFQRVLDASKVGEYNMGEYSVSEANFNTAFEWRIGSVRSQETREEQEEILNSSNKTNFSRPKDVFLHYDKVGYLPMIIGYSSSSFLGLDFTVCFRIGKIFNLLFYILLIVYAIKRTPIGKSILALIALLPTNIFLASSYSYDPAVFAGIAVFISEILFLYTNKNAKFTYKTALIIIASMCYACFTKATYAPLLLLTMLIPKKCFRNTKQSHMVKTGFFVIMLLMLSTLVLPALLGLVTGDTRGGDVSVSDQLSLMASYPFDYAEILNKTMVERFIQKLFGAGAIINFAYISTTSVAYMTNFYYILLFIIIFAFITDNKNTNLFKRNQRLAFLLSSLFSILFIWTALYVCYTPVGHNDINGVQDRYFLPIIFTFLIPLQSKNIKNNIAPKKSNAIIFSTYAIVLLAIVLGTMMPYIS